MEEQQLMDLFTKKAREFAVQLKNSPTLSALHVGSQELLATISQLLEEMVDDEYEHEIDDPLEIRKDAIRYKWSFEALDLGILLRDVELRVNNRSITDYSRDLDVETMSETAEIDKEIQFFLNSAIEETCKNLEEIQSEAPVNPAEWYHQKNPVSEILYQLGEIQDQKIKIYQSQEEIWAIVPAFNAFREHVLDHNSFRLVHLRALEKQLVQANQLLLDTEEVMPLTELLSLSKAFQKISLSIESEKIDSFTFEKFHCDLKDLQVPVYSNGGELFYKSIDINSNVESWIESEIFPTILDADSDLNNLYDSTLISLFNTRNKIENLALTEKESYDFNKESFRSSIANMLKSIEEYLKNLDDSITKLNVRTMEQLQIENLYDRNKEFLPELSFINITKLTGQRIWYESDIISDWKMRIKKFLQNRKLPFLKSLSLSPFEHVSSRELGPEDLDSNSLFLKKGYLGRSFFIVRKDKDAKFIKSLQNWQAGYQGSALILGDYGSGKSSYIEYLPNYVTDVPCVQISLHNTIRLNGRSHHVSHKLSETINFLAKNCINNPIVACLDDLERWQHGDQTMYDTVRDLTEGIAKYGKRIYFVVATNHFMFAHIQRLFDIESRFATILNMDKMYQKSVAKALVIRHNASLKEMEEDEKTNLSQRAVKIARKNKLNIGASMIAWERTNEEKDFDQNAIPPSFRKLVRKHELLLKIILTHKQINESKLRYMLSSSDNAFVSEELRKLNGYKIIQRTFDGFIQINPSVVFDVESSLKRIKTNKDG